MTTVTESLGSVDFPPASDININMMPFVIGDERTLPVFARGYAPLIAACDIEAAENGRVGYLTVTETPVRAGASQRRGGVHTERHPSHGWGGGGWGRGDFEHRRQGGIYLASNMGGTTAIWDVEVAVPGLGGDCEHLRSALGCARTLDANELIWMTDGVPHESLPSQRDGVRQFFRVVTSAIDLWFTQHSTANPLGVTPPAHVKLVRSDKFAIA
jgi:hypothetical protein